MLGAVNSIGATHKPVPSIVGANTAISGAGLFEAIDLLRELGFQTIEIHPFGVPQPTPGKFPGFEFPGFPEDQKRKLLQSLRGLRHLTTHLPYQGLSFVARDTGVGIWLIARCSGRWKRRRIVGRSWRWRMSPRRRVCH